MKRLISLLSLLLCLFLGTYFGYIVGVSSQEDISTVPPGSSKFEQIKQLISIAYVDKVNLDSLEELALYDFLDKFDPHTVYIPPKEAKEVEVDMKGKFGGIGVQFRVVEDTIRVIQVISGGPSERIGILAGDKIVWIDDSLFTYDGLSSDDVIKHLRGEIGTQVEVGVLRSGYRGERFDFNISRGEISMYSLESSYMLNDSTGYIKINRFAATTYEEFLNAISKFSREQLKHIIIDVRSNGGGYMGSVIQLLNEFLPRDDMIVYTQGAKRSRKDYRADGQGRLKDVGVMVLIDEYSASASEILAGAIQDNDRGIVLGRRSFGKGLVQEQYELRDGSMIRLTTARYYIASGRSIQKDFKEKEKYFREVFLRDDELMSSDSISLSDTSEYYTSKRRRIVYGGGGITPDVFIPYDTMGFTPFVRKIFSRLLQFHFAFSYVDKNRSTLAAYNTWEKQEAYFKRINLLSEFISYCKEKGVVSPGSLSADEKRLIERRLFSQILRNSLSDTEFYQYINTFDQALHQAVRYSSDIDKL